MTGVSGTNSAGLTYASMIPDSVRPAPAAVAQTMVDKHSDSRGGIDYPALKRDLEGLKHRDPELAAKVTEELKTQLGPATFQKLMASEFTIPASDGRGLTVNDDAPSLRSYFDGTAREALATTDRGREHFRNLDKAHYARLDTIWGDGNPATFEEAAISKGLGDLIASGLSLDAYVASRNTMAVAAANQQSAANLELALDVTQMTLDIVGIFDPIGVSDGANALISAGRGDWVGAGLSALAIVPVVGSLALVGKMGKWAETVAKAVDAAINNPAAREMLEPALRKLNDALNAIPEAAWKNMPDSLRTTLEGAKSNLDELFGQGAKRFTDSVTATAERLGVPPEKVQSILETPKGQRPDPSTYMTKEQIAAHLAKFDEGIVRVTSRSAFEKWGTVGPTPGFAFPKSELAKLIKETGGDLNAVERKLGLTKGTLSSEDTLIVLIKRDDATDLRLPNGNEDGANELWLPGGVTSGGVSEAVLSLPKGLTHQEIKL